MQDSYADAFVSGQHECLGVPLLPLTLRHAFTLCLAENPLAVGGRPTRGDLRQAVVVCSSADPLTIGGNDVMGWWARAKLDARTRRAGAEDFAAFRAYLDDYCASPSIWSKQQGARPSGCHWTLSTVVALMRDLHLSEADAWAMSPGRAQWYIAAAATQNPHIECRVWSEADEAAKAALEAMKEAG